MKKKSITKKEIQTIRSLKTSHGRKKHRAFIVEGVKNIQELLLSDLHIKDFYLTRNTETMKNGYFKRMAEEKALDFKLLNDQDFKKISTMQNPEGALAVCQKPHTKPLTQGVLPAIYLSKINNPGNLGTILRSAAWFGIRNILLSKNSVDPYNPKVVRASMGAVFRLSVITDIDENQFVKYIKTKQIPFFSADLKGENPVTFQPPKQYVLGFGSESHGVSQKLSEVAQTKLSIPRFGTGESLNLAVSASILLNSLINKG